jgi:hypothetical protein
LNAQKHFPRHLLTLVILGDIIRGKDACKKLKKRRVDLENGEEEKNGHRNTEEVSEDGLGGGHADEETAERVREEQTDYQLSK